MKRQFWTERKIIPEGPILRPAALDLGFGKALRKRKKVSVPPATTCGEEVDAFQDGAGGLL
jgi:hypothetical protein